MTWLSSGRVCGVLDESGNGNPDQPLIVGIAILEDLDGAEGELQRLVEKYRESYALEGTESFIEFTRNGFHATGDPLEIQIDMVNLLGRLRGYRVLMCFSDRSATPERSEEDRIVLLYRELIADAVRYFRKEEAHLLFESNSATLDRLFPRIVDRVQWAYELEEPDRERVRMSSEVRPKGDPLALSIIDYAMITFARWYNKGMPMTTSVAEYRNFRAIERNIAHIRFMDAGLSSTRSNRTFH